MVSLGRLRSRRVLHFPQLIQALPLCVTRRPVALPIHQRGRYPPLAELATRAALMSASLRSGRMFQASSNSRKKLIDFVR